MKSSNDNFQSKKKYSKKLKKIQFFKIQFDFTRRIMAIRSWSKEKRFRVWIGATFLFGLTMYVDEIKSLYNKYFVTDLIENKNQSSGSSRSSKNE